MGEAAVEGGRALADSRGRRLPRIYAGLYLHYLHVEQPEKATPETEAHGT